MPHTSKLLCRKYEFLKDTMRYDTLHSCTALENLIFFQITTHYSSTINPASSKHFWLTAPARIIRRRGGRSPALSLSFVKGSTRVEGRPPCGRGASATTQGACPLLSSAASNSGAKFSTSHTGCPPFRLALLAVSGPPASRARAAATGCDVTRTATCPRPFTRAGGSTALAGSSTVSGPGQKAARALGMAAVSATVCTCSTSAASSGNGLWTGRRFNW